MKKKYLVLVIVLSITILESYSQKTETVKTIFDLFNVSPEGCDINNYTIEPVSIIERVSIMEDNNTNNKIKEKKGEDLSLIMKKYTSLFQRSKTISKKFEKSPEHIIKFKNGNHSFKDKNKYGLMNATGNILIPAQFQTMIQSGNTGFVAYKKGLCNYYSTDGNKILNRDYFHIKPTIKNSLIVQTKKGFGLVSKEGKIILEPNYFQIKDNNNKEQFYYWILKSKHNGFYLSENTKDRISLNISPDNIEFIDSVYWYYQISDLINIKTKKKIICDQYIEILSTKHQLCSIDSKTKFKYLMKYNGDLVTNQPFVNINSFRENNLAIASIIKENKTVYGVINHKGEWMITPQYSSLSFFNDNKLKAINLNKQSGIITVKNKIITAFEYNQIRSIDEHYVLAVKKENKLIRSDIINLQNGKIIKKNLPYSSIITTKKCNKKVFIAIENRKECVINSKFDKISPASYTRVFYGANNSFRGINFLKNNKTQSQVFNCSGKLKTIKIKKKKYNTFYNYEEITPNLHHVLLTTDLGFFINAKGKAIENNNHWQDIKYSNSKDLFITMKYGGMFGIINSMGETIIPPIFEYISPFDTKTKLAKYHFDGRKQRGYITVDGELLFGTKYIETEFMGYNIFKVKNKDKFGVLNKNGNEIVPVLYSEIWLNGGIIYAKLGQSLKSFDLMGKRID